MLEYVTLAVLPCHLKIQMCINIPAVLQNYVEWHKNTANSDLGGYSLWEMLVETHISHSV